MFRYASFATLALVLLVAPGADAIFHVEKANVVVRLPADIAGSYDMAIANFGSPIYGATLSCVPSRFAHPACYSSRFRRGRVIRSARSRERTTPRLFLREAQHLTLSFLPHSQGPAGVPPRQPRRVLPLRACPRPARSRRDSGATFESARLRFRAQPRGNRATARAFFPSLSRSERKYLALRRTSRRSLLPTPSLLSRNTFRETLTFTYVFLSASRIVSRTPGPPPKPRARARPWWFSIAGAARLPRKRSTRKTPAPTR